MVYALIFVITTGSLFDIVTKREHWPFSPYRMFSSVRRDFATSKLRLLGVTESDPSQEISLLEPQYIQPLRSLHLTTSLRKNPRDIVPEQYYTEALHHVLERYEKLRIAGKHNGSKLRGIRLYKYHWKLDHLALNAARPDRRELILEIMYPIEK